MGRETAGQGLNGVVAAIAIAGLNAFAFADDQYALEEVIVTAQRYSQSLQNVPVSVTAVSQRQIEQAGVATLDEIQKRVPNVTLEPSRATNSTLTAFIRGVGQQDPLWGFEPGVGLYIDDIYIARPQGAVLDVYDIERVEVLRGPQGTLYGKNTIGGAVKYIPRRLSGETEAELIAAVGNYNQRDALINGQTAITNSLLVGAAFASFKRDGYGELLTFDKPNYDKEVLTGRVSLEWLPTDNLSFRLSYDRTEDKSNAKGGHRLTTGRITGAPVLNDVYDSRAGLGAATEVITEGAALNIEYRVDDDLILKSITGYREGESIGPIDFDNLAVNDFDVPASISDRQFSQEFQFIYSTGAWHAVAGLYYFKGDSGGRFDAILGQTVPGAMLGVPMPWVPLIQTTSGHVETTSYSIFADVTYDINEKWSVGLGGRYTEDEKDATVFSSQFFSLTGDPFDPGAIPFQLLTNYRNDKTYRELTPHVTGSYRFTEVLMGYVSYSKGFKSGGFDMRGNQAANPDTINGFDPETVDSYEAGIKGEFFERRLRLNLSVFYADYKDMQVVTLVALSSGPGGISVPVQNVENVGEATLQGGELESIAQWSPHWSTVLNLGYIDTEIDQWLTLDPANPSQQLDVADQRDIQNTPDWTAHLALMYDIDIGGKGALHASVAASYRGAVQMFEEPSAIDSGGYTLWDANIIWNSPNQVWSIGLHAKNLGDKEYRSSGYNFPGTGESSVIGYYGTPRTFTVNVGYRFR